MSDQTTRERRQRRFHNQRKVRPGFKGKGYSARRKREQERCQEQEVLYV